MSNRMKRIAVVMLAAACLAGCGKSTDTNAAKTAKASAESTETQKEKAPEAAKTSAKSAGTKDETEPKRILQTYNGKQEVHLQDGSSWTPPEGSRRRSDGYIVDEEGCVIGMDGTRPINDPRAVG